MFSHRVPSDLRPTEWARAKAAHGVVPYDLTVSNPTHCGIEYPRGLLEPLAHPASLAYRPDPKGMYGARESVAREYAARGVTVDPERILLTASSSESYAFLFKLLCDSGDTVLVPTPSYPLFAHLAALEGVRTAPFALDLEDGWQPASPEPSRKHDARAAILVHPNNPTGSFVETAAAERLAVRKDGGAIPLIVDEVFLDYPLVPNAGAATFAGRTSGLTFTLGGLSKSCGLPQLKLSWIVASGPERDVAAAIEKLEFIGDSYLSVATPIQRALPEILERSAPVRAAILARCAANLARGQALVRGADGVELLTPQGGWSAIVRFPRVVAEEELALTLLTRHGVAVHPGYFFDFPGEGYLVVSLLPEPDLFAAGLTRVLDTISSRL